MVTLVILPGWRQTKEDWAVAASRFSGINVIILELPGFGKTPLIDDAWGVPEYSDYVNEKIEKLRLDNIVLLGHSFGGRIASYIASQQPAWLKGLILYGAPCLYRPTLKAKLLSKIAPFAKKLGFSKKLSRNKELLEADNAGLGKIFRKTVGFDQTELLPKINATTLLLWGRNDTEAPLRLAQEMHTLIPNNTLEIIDNSGHHVHIDNQYIFYGKVKAFLDTL